LTATITSMPETVAAASAAGLLNNPDLALSTLYGGNTFNLALIAVMDIMYWKQPLLKVISHRHIKLLLGGVLLLVITGAAIFLGPEADWIIGPVAMISLLLLSMYIFVLYQQHKSPQLDEEADGNSYLEYTLRRLGLRLAGAAAAVVLAGIWLSYVGDRIAAETTLSSSFTGSLFLGISTSAPEMIVSFTALRIGARELAVANLTGSILYRSAAIVLPDLFYPGRSIFAAASTSNLIIVFAAVIMSLLVIAGLRWPGQRKAFVIAGWYTPFLLAIYFGSLYLLLTGNSG
jgi:cation:H+ antiporter